jgi:hypothetical protein
VTFVSYPVVYEDIILGIEWGMALSLYPPPVILPREIIIHSPTRNPLYRSVLHLSLTLSLVAYKDIHYPRH